MCQCAREYAGEGVGGCQVHRTVFRLPRTRCRAKMLAVIARFATRNAP
jgi:hypothetical protein